MNDKNSVLFEKLLNADEKQFAEALLEELHTINNGEKLTELAILASIKDLTAEKCDIINKESVRSIEKCRIVPTNQQRFFTRRRKENCCFEKSVYRIVGRYQNYYFKAV